MNIIKQISLNVAAKLRYDIPQDGTFLAIWEFNGEPYSATYRYRDSGNDNQLQVFVDGHGYCDAGCGAADDYYDLGQLKAMARGDDDSTLCKLIGIVVIEAE